MLVSVIRPDGHEVEFTYDALGRRLSKTFKNTVTKWLWDGNVPLHEWKEYLRTGNVMEGSETTWVFEADSFVPIAKIKKDKEYSIVADHLGTPVQIYSDEGEKVWERRLDSNGNVLQGTNRGCQFLFQGQYYDEEIELAYNRFRYYNPDTGTFISKDPIGLASGEPNFYAYVHDSNTFIDPFGLSSTCSGSTINLTLEDGWNIRDFSRKARALQDLAERGKLKKVSNTSSLRKGVAGQYKNRLIRRAYDTYDKVKADKLADRIRSLHADHIKDLQVSGLDEASNLWLLDPDVNVGLGRQIWQQIGKLPDGTSIDKINIIGL